MRTPIFHEAWWLDAVAPGRWREVRVEENNRVIARLPFVERRFLNVTMVLAPPLANRLGPITDLEVGRTETRLKRFDHIVDELLAQLPPADLIRQVLHPDVVSWLPFHRHGFRIDPQVSYVIDDLSDLDRVWSEVSGHTRRVIKKAGRELTVARDEDASRLMPMIRATAERRDITVPIAPDAVDRAVRASVERGRGTVLTAVDASGVVHASLFCVWDSDRAWYLGGGGDAVLRSSGAGSLLMWELIKEAAGRTSRFDFEGSMIPGVERYFRNFGGRQETCYLVTRTSRRLAPVWVLYQKLQQGRRTSAA
ncbi:GNAT family N-acetyltransferase [Actinomycetospora rhizophila]|uniref:GNAT family N-acetyltransferase n=1 Tax=Actinomycetospora rhizophila TaxID=1416876 RepID=A0ABV9ZL45_9PSEU